MSLEETSQTRVTAKITIHASCAYSNVCIFDCRTVAGSHAGLNPLEVASGAPGAAIRFQFATVHRTSAANETQPRITIYATAASTIAQFKLTCGRASQTGHARIRRQPLPPNTSPPTSAPIEQAKKNTTSCRRISFHSRPKWPKVRARRALYRPRAAPNPPRHMDRLPGARNVRVLPARLPD